MVRHLFIVAVASSFLTVGCGPKVPQHDGYKNKKYKPWAKPKMIEFDEDNEAEVDGWVDYSKRKRARWYLTEIPGDGELNIEMKVTAIGDGEEEEQDEEFDLAFEVLDEEFRVITTANLDDDDAGDRRKDRTLYELPQGKYYVHVYAQARLDKAEFAIEMKWKRGSIEEETNFPKEVDWPPTLALVPAFDDTPVALDEPKKKKKKKYKKKKYKKKKKKTDKKETKKDDKPKAGGMAGRIVNLSAAGGGTRITINRGSSKGVEVGWKGAVINSKGQSIPDGTFTIDKVTASESQGTVGASRDAVEAAKRVYIRP
jgi:hypothetical protein